MAVCSPLLRLCRASTTCRLARGSTRTWRKQPKKAGFVETITATARSRATDARTRTSIEQRQPLSSSVPSGWSRPVLPRSSSTILPASGTRSPSRLLQITVSCRVTTPAIKSVMATSATSVEVEFTVAMQKASSEDKTNYTVSGSPVVPINAAKLIAKDTVELTLGEEMVAEHEYTLEVKDVESEDGDMVSGTRTFDGYAAIVKGDGELEVSLSSKNPRGDTVPKGAVGVVLLSTDFTASCKDKVEVENLTVLHEGFGESTDVDGVYAAVNGARVTR